MGRDFYTKMNKDGRIVVPKLILADLGRFKSSLEGYTFQVILEPS